MWRGWDVCTQVSNNNSINNDNNNISSNNPNNNSNNDNNNMSNNNNNSDNKDNNCSDNNRNSNYSVLPVRDGANPPAGSGVVLSPEGTEVCLLGGC